MFVRPHHSYRYKYCYFINRSFNTTTPPATWDPAFPVLLDNRADLGVVMISGLTVCCSQNVTVSFLPAFTGILYEKSEAISEGDPGAGACQGD